LIGKPGTACRFSAVGEPSVVRDLLYILAAHTANAIATPGFFAAAMNAWLISATKCENPISSRP